MTSISQISENRAATIIAATYRKRKNFIRDVHTDICHLNDIRITLFLEMKWIQIKANGVIEKQEDIDAVNSVQKKLSAASKRMNILTALFEKKFPKERSQKNDFLSNKAESISYFSLSEEEAIQNAKNFACRNGPISPVPIVLKPSLTIKELFKQILESCNGVVISWPHDPEGDEEFLVTYLEILSEERISQLYIEGFDIKFQKAFDEFFEDRSLSNLAEKLSSAQWIFKHYVNVFKEADKLRVRIMCSEIKHSKGNTDRYLGMNYYTAKIIQENAKGVKFAFVGGAMHSTSFCKGAVCGLSNYLQCPVIDVYKNEKEKSEVQEIINGFSHSRIPPHAEIILNPEPKVRVIPAYKQ